MTALIDADSLVYIIAWNYKEMGTADEVKQSCDNFLRDILTLTQADDYIGVFSPSSDVTFRATEYKYAKYKGNRPDKPEFVTLWEKVIKEHFTAKHGFFTDPSLEADDVVAGHASILMLAGQDRVICSPDKDLRQVAGLHFDFRTGKDGALPNQVFMVPEDDAYWNFWMQMLTGDDSDNIAGVPGLGPVKAKKIIDELKEHGDKVQTRSKVLASYCKYFGGYYGPIIFSETEKAIRLMIPSHPLYESYASILEHYASTQRKTLGTSRSFFDLTS